jgi:colanic acid/amylovoran biosynthesis glycosyltransferase
MPGPRLDMLTREAGGKRIAYLVNQYPKVSHTFIRRELQALERHGHQVFRIALRGWEAPLVDEEDQKEQERTWYVLRDGVFPLIFSFFWAAFFVPRKLALAACVAVRMGLRAQRPMPYHLVYLAEACHVVRWLKAAGADHLHAHFGTNSAEVAMFARILGGPSFSFTVHGPYEFDRPEYLGLPEKVRWSSFVVAVSSYGRSQLYRWIEYIQWPKVQVVHCAVGSEFTHFPIQPAPATARVVCVGRLCEQKGQLLLVEAIRLLKQKGIDVELVLAGDGEKRTELEGLISMYGLNNQVRITGWLSGAQVREEMLAARALVLPSFAEGLPVVIMEAMALCRPVLTTYVGGIPELVQHGEHGWLFPAGSIEALVAAMETLFQTPLHQIHKMGAAARVRVIARHSADKEAAKLARLFWNGPLT